MFGGHPLSFKFQNKTKTKTFLEVPRILTQPHKCFLNMGKGELLARGVPTRFEMSQQDPNSQSKETKEVVLGEFHMDFRSSKAAGLLRLSSSMKLGTPSQAEGPFQIQTPCRDG